MLLKRQFHDRDCLFSLHPFDGFKQVGNGNRKAIP